MAHYTFHYRHTEYRTLSVDATNPEDAVTKFLNGDGHDEFVTTGNDPIVLGVDECTTNGEVPLFDAFTDLDSMADPAVAHTIYRHLHSHAVCDTVGA